MQDTNLIKGIDKLADNKRNYFTKDKLTIENFYYYYYGMTNKDFLSLNTYLQNNLKKGYFDDIKFEVTLLICSNIIEEFLKVYDNSPELEKYKEDYKFYDIMLFQALLNKAQIIEMQSKIGIDFSLSEVQTFYKEFFDLMERDIWNIKFSDYVYKGFINHYNQLKDIMSDLDENQFYDEVAKNKIREMFDEMNILKSKIAKLEFDNILKYKNNDHFDFDNSFFHKNEDYSGEKSGLNKISEIDKQIYFSKINFKKDIHDFIKEDMKELKKRLNYEKPIDYISLGEITKNERYIKFSFKEDIQSQILFVQLKSFVTKNVIFPEKTNFTRSNEKVEFIFEFRNQNNRNVEEMVYKEFINIIADFSVENDFLKENSKGIREVMLRLDVLLREADLLFKLTNDEKAQESHSRVRNKI